MSENRFTISQARLNRAKSVNEQEWLSSTFSKAARVINAGGKVKIMQPPSHTSPKADAIIDTLEMLDYFRKMYSGNGRTEQVAKAS